MLNLFPAVFDSECPSGGPSRKAQKYCLDRPGFWLLFFLRKFILKEALRTFTMFLKYGIAYGNGEYLYLPLGYPGDRGVLHMMAFKTR